MAANDLFWRAYRAARGQDGFDADTVGLENDDDVRAAVNHAVREPAYVQAEVLALDAKGHEKRTWAAYANSVDMTARRSRFNPVLAAESGFFRELRTDRAVTMSIVYALDVPLNADGSVEVRVRDVAPWEPQP